MNQRDTAALLRNLSQAVDEAAPSEIPDILAALGTATAAAAARLENPQSKPHPSTNNDEELLDVAQAACKLNVSTSWVRHHIAELPVRRVGRRTLFSPTELDRWSRAGG